ncbi:hypothetical protein DSM104443_03592 [Usitatibacter rugosus]|uniref:Uncharacterized protein n=1 Tax=Usitatibacter rugosus TaxID=2732067 RepID=A0A6M4GZ43_9PROT|nr:hypothetical protein [Usitatibacter rugosus]QJR12506.1 hypothetical protein DSM104443_03592 [Usitatibacter rugosus]
MKAGAPALANAASRQPMLAERAARLHAQVARGVFASRAQRALAATLVEFDAGLKDLLAAAPSAEVRETYRMLQLLWQDYRPHVARTALGEAPEKLGERSEEVVWIAAKGARLLRDPAADAQTARVRLAGEARFQSQRIARIHFFTAWIARSDKREAELATASRDFRRALDALLAAPADASGAAAELQLAENQSGFLAQAGRDLKSARDSVPGLEAVAKTCDNILEVMDRVAALYESVPA